MDIMDILNAAIQMGASDLFILPGSGIHAKVGGELRTICADRLMPKDTQGLLSQIYALNENRSMDALNHTGDDDFSFSVRDVGRFRCNAYKQRNSLAAVLRIVSFDLPNAERMHIPDAIIDLYQLRNGLVLVTGPAGSGKSTTLACLIDQMNQKRKGHIITIEDPIEFLHPHQNCIVSQREVAHDTHSYGSALRAALRQAPDVILLGEMRDFETIQTALTASETGQLVLSTLHTIGAATTIDRIIDVFPANQQQQVRVQLSMSLRAVISQQLVPGVHGGLEPAFEIMIVTPAIQNMLREGKVHQIDNVIYAGTAQGMRTMDADLFRLYQEGKISREAAICHATNPDLLARKLIDKSMLK